MMKKYLLGTVFALALVCAVTPAANAQTTGATTTVSTTTDLSTLIQSLLKQVQELQKQLAALRGEIQELRSGLREGVENEDVRKIQELLATDPTIYPKGIVSGYYGALTKEAIMAFQKRHGLPETGEVDEATKQLLQDYLKKKTDKKVAPGWIKAYGLEKKIEDKKWFGDSSKDEDEDEDEDSDDDKKKDHSANSVSAEGLIDLASSVIDDLEDKIEDAEEANKDADDIADAKDDLARAKAELAIARGHYEDEEWQKAFDEAYKAKYSAYAGIDELK